jgi:hypothetical protein
MVETESETTRHLRDLAFYENDLYPPRPFPSVNPLTSHQASENFFLAQRRPERAADWRNTFRVSAAAAAAFRMRFWF